MDHHDFSRIRTVSFDAFGTLVRFDRPRRPFMALLNWLREHGVVLPEGVREQVMSHTWDLRACAQALGASPDLLTRLPWSTLFADLEQEAAGLTAFEDSLTVLHALRERGYRLAIASNLAEPYVPMVQRTLEQFPFDVQAWSCRVGAVKPDARFFDHLAPRRGDAVRLLHVGDTWSDDVVGAQRVGATAVFLDRRGRGIPREQAGQAMDVLRLDRLTGLLRHLPGC